MCPQSAKPQIVVIGGGFGGLEAAFYLRKRLPEQADITLVSDRHYFLYKPNSIYVPFGLDPETLKIQLDAPTRIKDVTFIQATARAVDPIKRFVLIDNYKLYHDYLIVAVGAKMRPEEIPGLADFAHTIWTPEEMLRLRARFNQLVDSARAGERREVLFVQPPNNLCPSPLYEIVMMLDTWLRRHQVRDHINLTWSTYEESYLQVFGPRLHEEATQEFERRGINHYTHYVIDKVDSKRVEYKNGENLPYDLLVTFPAHVPAACFSELPQDERGFITTVPETRQVVGYPDIYVAGDMANFPLKQAFLALLQGDAIAEHLAAHLLNESPHFSFNPVSIEVMEQLDTATFAQVPLQLTGIPDQPIEVRANTPDVYRVGSSPIWRLGKRVVGTYLPRRFEAGEPFHAGISWKGIETGLKIMSDTLAH